MIEQKALAYINMYGILGALENLCECDNKAKEIIASLKKPVALCFQVKNGPCCTFNFSKSGCKMTEGSQGCTCKMNFSSPEKFNSLISCSKLGIPSKNPIGCLSFLAGSFSKLTDRLNEVLRPNEKALETREFFEENTLMTLYVIADSISALANNDSISKQSAEHTVDGKVLLGIKDKIYITINVKNHIFSTVKAPCENPRAIMEFSDIELANGLFAGKVSTVNEMCKGNIKLSGMISMLDNINRILDRVSVYLG